MGIRTRSKYIVFCFALFCLVSFVFYTRRYYSIGTADDIVQVQITPSYPSSAAETVKQSVVVYSACPGNITSSLAVARRPVGGFVVAFRFWEQQTQAMKSLVQLQCLATRMGLRVVEPFLYGSLLGLQLEALSGDGYPHLSDLIDVDVWNRETTGKFGLFPLAQWSEFLRDSPKDLVIVCMKYRNPPRIRIPAPGFDYTKGCPAACFDKFNKTIAALTQYDQFRVVWRVCANFADYAGVVKESSFVENVLARFDYRKVTVLINEFRGFFGLYRAQIASSCAVDFFKPDLTIVPSARIMSDAQKYVTEVFKGRPYVAVLARIERVVLHLGHNLTECSLTLKSLLKDLSREHSTTEYFLAMDIGKFGSSGATTHNLTAAHHGALLLDAVYGGTLSFDKWESTFETYTSRVEGAYVANLQRAIASQAVCLVMFGAGGFQGQARDLYEKRHMDTRYRCIHKICHDHKGTASLHVRLS